MDEMMSSSAADKNSATPNDIKAMSLSSNDRVIPVSSPTAAQRKTELIRRAGLDVPRSRLTIPSFPIALAMFAIPSGQWLLGIVAFVVALILLSAVVPNNPGAGMNVNTLDFSPGSRSRSRVYRTISTKFAAAFLPNVGPVLATAGAYFGMPVFLPEAPPWLIPLFSAAFFSTFVAAFLKAGITDYALEGRNRALRALDGAVTPVSNDARQCVTRGNNPLLIQTLLVLGAVCGIQVFAKRVSHVSELSLDDVLASARDLEQHGLVKVSTVAHRSTPGKWYLELTAQGVQAAADTR
ncbi:hypothetical protein CMUST_04205 [Corynebacterium mustelae]|uniref:Uncharacterized protein n=2 Tax=Corynebacterium mustelae TaxID=571915 RepID=A0A0G3GVM6_9CORY|nr:hypothetical protein CMUST_04205 [Corynebacterium mustelae]